VKPKEANGKRARRKVFCTWFRHWRTGRIIRAKPGRVFVFYNFCRVHATIKTSPAVASGLTDHVWTLEELIGLLG